MGSIPLWEFLVRIVVLYFAVMFALRIMGKREIGQLSVFDFVVSVMLAELSTLPMEDTKVSLPQSLIPIASLVLLQLAVALLQLKSHRFRHWVDGEPSVLIEHGAIKDSEMKKMHYTMHDLLTQLREKGFSNAADVEFAILETSGELSVFPKPDAAPVTPRDMNIRGSGATIPLPLVVDGNPVAKTLLSLNKDRQWIENELRRRGYPSLENVFYAAIDSAGTIVVDPKDPSHSTPSSKAELSSKQP
ncbi:DUF421 domain-containing protein [Alicyclobacillus sp. SO9]|uniref:DUF421 domain-containing protein n=1 Tax=Alicyclobacillus sp. SO9 TaxID=2665646 RepID=UPI001E2A8D1A|nr:DUF421 domain-containing protein [Alicyclobacillus sp. SO9]